MTVRETTDGDAGGTFPAMTSNPLPELRPVGPVWREVRLELGLRQSDVAAMLGFQPSTGQAMVSYREKAPDEPMAVAPRIEELVAFEDAAGLQRGYVLRRAGYVVDAADDDPLELVRGWSWLPAGLRDAVVRIVEPEWKRRGARPRRRSTRAGRLA